ncbi:MAG: response regulator [Candidatus Muirbacterium halophilum]|nr:response regulator [Candidatus Muirbacterium halophilum]MCK9475693.1 response regulator [Candidatus Muirbacterium halophilum]
MNNIISENIVYYNFSIGILFLIISYLLKLKKNSHIRFSSFIVFIFASYKLLEAFNMNSKIVGIVIEIQIFLIISLSIFLALYYLKPYLRRNIFIVFFLLFSLLYLFSKVFSVFLNNNFVFILSIFTIVNSSIPFFMKKINKKNPEKNIYLFFLLIALASTLRLIVDISVISLYSLLFISLGVFLYILQKIYNKKDNVFNKKIIWISFLSSIVILIIISVFIINISENIAENILIKDAKFKSREISKVLNDNLEIYMKGVRLLAEEDIIFDYLDEKKQEDYLKSNIIVDRYFDILKASVVYVMDKNGNTVVSSNRDSTTSILGYNYSFRNYFKTAMEGIITYYFAVGITTNERGFYTSFPFKKDGEIKGVAVIKKNLDIVESIIPDENPIFIVNDLGVILMSNNKEYVLKVIKELDEYDFNNIVDSRQFEGLKNTSLFSQINHKNVKLNGFTYYMEEANLKYANWKVIFLANNSLVTNYRNFSYIFIIILFVILLILFDFLRKEYSYIRSVIGSEKKYRTLFENSPNMIGLLDKKFRFLEMNRKFSWVSGLSQNDFSDIDLFTFWKNLDKNEIQHVKDKILSGKIFIREILFTPYDNNYDKQLLIMLSPIDNDNIIFIGVDITEERRMERELYEEQERIIVTINSIEEGVINTDKKGNILLINKIAQNIIKSKGDVSIGKNISICNIKLNNNEYNPILKVVTTEKNNKIIKNITIGPENIPIYMNIAPTFNNLGKVNGAVIAFRDIRVEKKIEEEMINLQKLESIGLFAAGIAHDFNNILTSVLGNISIVEKNFNKNEKIYQHLKNAENACMNAKELTMQLLTFAKRETPNKELINLKKAIKDTAEFSIRGTNNRLVLDIEDKLWNIEADIGKIKQVINNVIINSCQAMLDGGNVYLGATNQALFNEGGKSGNFVKISVKDTGNGIEKNDISRIFDPYFTTKKEGTGLGLASVLAIVKNHEGFIEVFSEKNQGTRFDIFLPAVIEGIIKEKNYENEILVKGKGRVVVMDDEQDVREVIKYMLEELGYEVEECEKGEELIAKYKAGLRFDFAVMDLTIKGGLGGVETMKELLHIDKNIKVIVASGYSQNDIAENYRKYGFSSIVNKPFTLNDLSEAIKAIKIVK